MLGGCSASAGGLGKVCGEPAGVGSATEGISQGPKDGLQRCEGDLGKTIGRTYHSTLNVRLLFRCIIYVCIVCLLAVISPAYHYRNSGKYSKVIFNSAGPSGSILQAYKPPGPSGIQIPCLQVAAIHTGQLSMYRYDSGVNV